MNGWIKLYPKLLNNPVVMKDGDHLAVWVYLLLKAVWKPVDVMFGGQTITLKAGELTTGRRIIASELHINESKVQRILKRFENEQLIEQRTDRQCRLISIVNWTEYQQSEQRNEQRVNNDRTTSEQRVNTKEDYIEDKTIKNNKTIYTSEIAEIVDYLNAMTGQHYRANTKKTVELIEKWLKLDFTVEDFKTVIYKKAREWGNNPKMVGFLRPETLFGNKFESYLNQVEVANSESRWRNNSDEGTNDSDNAIFSGGLF